MENVLAAVRDTRNALAHFREVTAKQRHQLRFAAEWLKDHRPRQILASQPVAEQGDTYGAETMRVTPAPSVVATGTTTRATASVAPVEEELNPNDSRYARLALYLRARDADDDVLTFTFEQIEAIIGDRLPATANQHRLWWANDSQGHVQSKQWLDVGWRVASVDTEAQTVVFARSEKRAQAYRSFFSSLLSALAQRAQTCLSSASPDGRSWVQVDDLSDTLGVGSVLFCSFARSGRFRVELYIDTGDAKENKRRFDALYERRSQIEDVLHTPVAWERMNEQRACRVALYREGAITDEREVLADLCMWASRTVNPFRESLAAPASESI